ncbi:RagB/SusD family nutrient uptake outer membrane protein [Flavilitoribacter nigricans]|uniref:RagB/SusD family nutrient uptake outer membrane protein n=1 Tax=Flavilitoribacter nigricans (strain ATCC 23147 / DSM 23189 / NBRC 102662 / NCIMB 1420 / SS-2) TaxID=1122177 RepID=A0A2D0N7X6_FLAN2|nr:RagB/SusD family nutrient uptake outer membrane protein [Flavilitoribacter nigricans]PHN04490.1 RagB/SusD family nutrient uptake outer membrane protein [Flavilitoribacter nigricans DSM 23189 = NBRC 102662]
MKFKSAKYSLLIVGLLVLMSCNDDFLERYPLDEISNETFWNTENDLAVYNNSFYNLARNDNDVPILMGHDEGFNSHKFGIWYTDEYTDNIAPRHSRHTQYQQVRSGKHNVPSSANGDGQWYGYKGWNFLRAINVGMDNYDRAQIDQEVKNKYIGEARLFRGWFFADKVAKFGDAPWVDHELNVDSEELYAARTPREQVMANVLEDLNFATQSIPNDWGDGGGPGRLNRWAALLVKSRVCLFEGTWRKYHGGSNADMWLQEAAAAAKEIMDDGPYTLYSTGDPENDYNAIHLITADLTGVPEVMYWRRYELGILTNHVQSYHRGYNGGATKSIVEDYLCEDGLPITLSPLYQGDAQIEDVFENRDPRLRQTILHPDDVLKYGYGNFDTRPYPRLRGMEGGQTIETGYHIIKVFDPVTSYATYNTSNTPAITLRFGEVLLNYAEAMAELGRLTQEDLDLSINRLRDRVGMPHMDLNNIPVDPRYVSDDVSPLIVEIRRERRVELFMEGFRYDDLRRWKQGKKLEIPSYGIRWDEAAMARYPKANVVSSLVDGVPYVDIYKGTDWANPVFDESKHYLWPIPLADLAQNPNIRQNPGW